MAQYVYGKNVVKQMIKDNSPVLKCFLSSKDSEIENLVKKKHIELEYCDKNTIEKMCKSKNHQGVCLKIESYKEYSVDDMINNLHHEHGLIVMLDEIEDPHNLGAILRTCDCVGVDGVIIKKNNAVGLNSTVAKVSAGAIDTVKVATVTNLVKTLEYLKQKGYWVCGTGFENAIDYRELDVDRHLVVVIGNEGKGITRLVKENCDWMVKLPMEGKITSLNASVATAVLLYQIHNKRFPL